MVLPQGLEPWTSSFVDSRSNPTELQEHLVLQERLELPTPALEERCSLSTELLEYKSREKSCGWFVRLFPREQSNLYLILMITYFAFFLYRTSHNATYYFKSGSLVIESMFSGVYKR